MTRPDLPAGTGLGLGVLALLIVVAVLGEGGDGGGGGGGEPVPPSAAALSVYDGRSPSEAGGSRERVLVELPRPALADRDDLDSLSPADQRAYLRSLSEEGRALRSALGARGVALRDAVTFGRTWDGFAATVDASDLAALSSLGVRARPVRRFYPATSEPVPVPGGKPSGSAAPAGGPIAILDTGASAPGYDTLDRDSDPSPGADPRAPSRRETSGAALAAIVTAAGERAMTIRVAGYGSTPEVHGTSDTLIAGLERAVDPNGDGAVDDAVRVALVGVNAPYAGFGDSPEAQAVRGAGKLGTLVVAPAGNEGPARPPNGVVGSPGSGARRAHRRRHRGRRGRPARDGHHRRPRARRRHRPRRQAGAREARRTGDEHRHRGAPPQPPERGGPRRARPRGRQPGRPGHRRGRRGSARGHPRRPPRPPPADDALGPRPRPRRRPDRQGREGRPGGEGGREGDVRPREGGRARRRRPAPRRSPRAAPPSTAP